MGTDNPFWIYFCCEIKFCDEQTTTTIYESLLMRASSSTTAGLNSSANGDGHGGNRTPACCSGGSQTAIILRTLKKQNNQPFKNIYKQSTDSISMPKKEDSEKTAEVNRILVENFVSLQKAMTHLAVKFDSLSEQISKLLQLFEISAKSFAEKEKTENTEKDKDFLMKVDTLLEQNKTIAKGLTLMDERVRSRIPQSPQSAQEQMPRRPLPRI